MFVLLCMLLIFVKGFYIIGWLCVYGVVIEMGVMFECVFGDWYVMGFVWCVVGDDG